MPTSVAELFSRLNTDPWREEVGFSNDFEEANKRLFNPGAVDPADATAKRIATLSNWLQHHQPCLFGKIAAKAGFLSYCILDEGDLRSSDQAIQDKIQTARLEWTKDGFEGKKNGFIILAISEKLAKALPDEACKELASRLCSLYLLREVVPDEIFHDVICLEKPGRDPTTWQWSAGVNYFCAQGDKRWWQDHRIPGGMGFSVNSVGHMVKSGILSRCMVELETALQAPPEGWDLSKVDSLDKALLLAMQTIKNASEAVSGKATELLSIPQDHAGKPVIPCKVKFSSALADKDYTQYLGRYHTDVTVPSEYFRPDVERPPELQACVLDFTYLFHRDIENPDYISMGEGRRIRDDGTTSAGRARAVKRARMEPVSVNIESIPRLRESLRSR